MSSPSLTFMHVFGAALLVSGGLTASAMENDLSRATWDYPTHEVVRMHVETWVQEVDLEAEVADQIRAMWDEPVPVSRRLSLLAKTFALADADARELVSFCRRPKNAYELPEFAVLVDQQKPPFEVKHLKLLYARWLAQHQFYNETLDQLASLQPSDVVTPDALLFYRGVAHHRLLRKQDCLAAVDQLLEREQELPKRFATVAQLMRMDIEPLEADSLNEVSRLMDSIQVRLGHGRAGKRVRDEEEDVIEKLDKMIKQMEDQAQSAAAAAAAGQAGDAKQSSSPMQDSLPGGAKGPGNVDAKDLGQRAGWGNLPAKEREQALQQLGKDFPSHYRDVIEEYFRKLAREAE